MSEISPRLIEYQKLSSPASNSFLDKNDPERVLIRMVHVAWVMSTIRGGEGVKILLQNVFEGGFIYVMAFHKTLISLHIRSVNLRAKLVENRSRVKTSILLHRKLNFTT